MLSPLRIARTSDVHLDDDNSEGQCAQGAVAQVVDAALAQGAQPLPIARDLIDRIRVCGHVIDFEHATTGASALQAAARPTEYTSRSSVSPWIPWAGSCTACSATGTP